MGHSPVATGGRRVTPRLHHCRAAHGASFVEGRAAGGHRGQEGLSAREGDLAECDLWTGETAHLLVAAPWLRQTAREGDLPYEGRSSELRGGQLQRMTMSVGALSRETNSLRDDDSRTCSWGRESFIRARHASSAAHTRAVPDHRPARIGEVSRGAPMDGRGGRMSQNHRQYRVPDARHLGVRVALGRSALQSLSGIE